MQTRLAAALAISLAAGCTSEGDEPSGPVDIHAPRVEVTAPVRGSIAGDVGEVVVEGSVSDEVGVATVTVNGVVADVAADGTFRASVPVFAGTNLLQTLAYDEAGNVGSDTRATLAGVLSPVTTPLPDSVLATLSADTFQAIGDAAADFVETADLEAMIAPGNPVIDVGGRDCLYVYANLNYFDLSTSSITLTPADGGLWMSATIRNLDARFDGHYKVACISGNDDLFATATSATVSGFLAMDIAGGDFDLDLQGAEVTFQNLSLDATGFPGAILDIVDFFASLEGIVGDALVDAVVPMVDGALAGLSQERSVTVLDTQIDFAVRPSIIEVDAAGATVRLDASIEVAGAGDAPGFVYTTNQVPNLDHGQGFSVGLADDVANELFAAYWAAGGMELDLDLTTGDYGSLGALFDRVTVEALLPPSVSASGGDVLLVTVGDLMATFWSEGAPVTKMAINGTVGIGASADPVLGTMRLAVDEPNVEVDLLDEDVTGANALSGDAFEELISFAATRLASASGSVVDAIALPSIGGVSLGVSDVGGVNGYLMVEGELQP